MSRPGYMKQVDEQAFWEWISWHPGYNVPDRSRRIRVSQETPGLENPRRHRLGVWSDRHVRGS